MVILAIFIKNSRETSLDKCDIPIFPFHESELVRKALYGTKVTRLVIKNVDGGFSFYAYFFIIIKNYLCCALNKNI